MASRLRPGYKARMRILCLILIGLVVTSAAVAETLRPVISERAVQGKVLPLKKPTAANSCAEYGAGFVKVEGTESCVKIGGAISADFTTSNRR
jgi:hypothetical protein